MYPYFVCGFLLGHANIKMNFVPVRQGASALALMFPVLLLHFRTEHFIYETGVWLIGMLCPAAVMLVIGGISIFVWLLDKNRTLRRILMGG